VIWLRFIPALFLSSLVLAVSFSGMAQPAPAESAAPEPAAVATPEHARLLAGILEDEQARRALIDELRRIAEGRAGPAAPESTPPEPQISVAGGLAAYTREFAEAVTETMYELQAWMVSLWASLMTGGNADLETLGEAALALGGIIGATLVIYYSLGLAAQGVFRWLAGRARDGRFVKRAFLLIASGLITLWSS
jgi:moderate conductance mechanosensitive channel